MPRVRGDGHDRALGYIGNSDFDSLFMNDKSEGETRMSRKKKARRKSRTDISDDITLLHWSGMIDPSCEPWNSVLKD